ncbi:type VI secretion system protein TssA [Pseudoduganella sp. UC29_106]|uniref:type VI secretion system protein TssA n=1 Tax=Pseudoduganella sp. UC29_106 TaxID=3374553 RepID=UPI0037580FD0
MAGIEQLLIPVSVAEPCGEDISFSAELDAIARARQHDEPGLAQGEWAVALREADWPLVASQCAALIQSRSKDLKLAVWLAEAQARTLHFRGLADGFALMAGLCERYWERLHPLGEPGDYEQRVGNLAWLLAQTPRLVKHMPVSEDGAVTMMDFDRARQRAARAGACRAWRLGRQHRQLSGRRANRRRVGQPAPAQLRSLQCGAAGGCRVLFVRPARAGASR